MELVNLETGEIKWDEIKKLQVSEKNDETFYNCKKCNIKFSCKAYNGNYPLCSKHRNNNTFKKTFINKNVINNERK